MKINVFLTHNVFLITIAFLVCSCSTVEPEPEVKTITIDSIIKTNENALRIETEQINNYINRHGWQMKQTATGLRFMKYYDGKGDKVVMGNTVLIHYRVGLINGDIIYSSKDDIPFMFITGKAEVVNGLEEAVLMMLQGDKAKVIVPSHLAYGLLGDENKIPKRATLVYDIEIISTEK